MSLARAVTATVVLAALSGCNAPEPPSPDAAPAPVAPVAPVAPARELPPAAPATPRAAAFTDRVWTVQASSAVEPGTTYAFLGDGTLVVDGPGGEPMRGRWAYRDGALSMVEEGITYPVDILALEPERFVLLSHNPGEPVEITLVPARGVPLPVAR